LVGITLADMATWSDIWIYLLGTVAGGVLAAIVFGFTYGKGD
jgi:glycerol uptake facilitator-like aquaporin